MGHCGGGGGGGGGGIYGLCSSPSPYSWPIHSHYSVQGKESHGEEFCSMGYVDVFVCASHDVT